MGDKLNIANPILSAVDLLVSERISGLDFDKTIQAKVTECVDTATGKYKLAYQDSIIYAYSQDLSKSYVNNTQVYVRVPNGDFSNGNKEIIGTVKKLGTDYIDVVTTEARFVASGVNCIKNSTNEYGLKSYKEGGDTIVLYDRENGIKLIDFEEENIQRLYAADMTKVLMGATFRTALDSEQRVGQGHYGIMIKARYYNGKYARDDAQNRQYVDRTYVLDVDNMTGQPYNYVVPTRQYAIFDCEGDNYYRIEYVGVFCTGFPLVDNTKEADIFVSLPEWQFMEALTNEELSGNCLKILTPDYGMFKADDREEIPLEARLQVQGRILTDTDTTIHYYWGVEDASVDSSSPYYCSSIGQGWRCLNPSREIDSGLYLFTPAAARFIINRDMCIGYETRFKCAAVFGDGTARQTVTGMKKIYNNGANYRISIVSSKGNQFYWNIGSTELTAIVEVLEGSTWVPYLPKGWSWGYYDNTNTFYPLETNSATIEIGDMSQVVDMRIYKVTCYSDEARTHSIGTTSSTIKNLLGNEGEYNLVINNGTEIYKYSEGGVSPASPTQISPITPKELSFDLFDPNGEKIEDDILISNVDFFWTIPIENSLLKFDLEKLEHQVDQGGATATVRGTTTLPYSIADLFNVSKRANTIFLHCNYQGLNLVAETNFTFTKEGELGTNGSEYYCKIVPATNDNDKVAIQWNRNGNTIRWRNTQNTNTYPFHVKLYQNEELIFENDGLRDLTNLTGYSVAVEWDFMEKNVGSKSTNFTINGSRFILKNTTPLVPNRNIIQAKVTVQSNPQKVYYATYSIPVYLGYDINNYYIEITGGFDYCMYHSDGTNPEYARAENFKATMWANGQDVSSQCTFSWSANGNFIIYNGEVGRQDTDADGNIIPGGRIISPKATFDGLDVDNYLTVTVTYGVDTYQIIWPVQMYLNRYGMAALNGWDGNSIEINNDENYILTPQIGAGIKNSDNSFTGMVMGKTMQATGTTKIGLLGYGQGKENIFLNAETGEATFGVSGDGQVILRPNGDSYISGWKINRTSISNETNTTKVRLLSSSDADARAIEVTNGNYGSGTGTKQTYIRNDGYLYSNSGLIGQWYLDKNALLGVSSETNRSAIISNLDSNTTYYNGKYLTSDGTIEGTAYNGVLLGYGYMAGPKWWIARNGNATFNYLTANQGGQIAGWTINDWGLSAQNIQIRSDGSLTVPNGWSITSAGNATFNNLTANNVWNLGSGNNTWTSGGSFTFNNGTLGNNSVGTGGFAFTLGNIGFGSQGYGSNGITASHNGNVVISGTIYAAAGEIAGDLIVHGTLDANKVDCINLNASNVSTGTLKAEFIDVAGVINAGKANIEKIVSDTVTADFVKNRVQNAGTIQVNQLITNNITKQSGSQSIGQAGTYDVSGNMTDSMGGLCYGNLQVTIAAW